MSDHDPSSVDAGRVRSASLNPSEQAHLGGGSVGVEIGQDDGQILGVGQEADNVGVIRPNEVEPTDRKAFDSSDSEP